jgi:sec-independent protein translocase protein TatA
MGTFSIGHWLIVLVVVLILFGAGKLPKVMGDLAKGIKNFKSGLKEEGDDTAAATPAEPKTIGGGTTVASDVAKDPARDQAVKG